MNIHSAPPKTSCWDSYNIPGNVRFSLCQIKELMQSQFASLEKPKNAIIIDARNPLDEVIDRVVKAI